MVEAWEVDVCSILSFQVNARRYYSVGISVSERKTGSEIGLQAPLSFRGET